MTDRGITQNQILSQSTVSLGDSFVHQNSELKPEVVNIYGGRDCMVYLNDAVKSVINIFIETVIKDGHFTCLYEIYLK